MQEPASKDLNASDDVVSVTVKCEGHPVDEYDPSISCACIMPRDATCFFQNFSKPNIPCQFCGDSSKPGKVTIGLQQCRVTHICSDHMQRHIFSDLVTGQST